MEDRYSSKPEVSMMTVHGALSRLLHAVQEEVKDVGAYVTIGYNRYTYLTVEVEVWNNKAEQVVVDRLRHGIVWGHYDFRFRSISRPVGCSDFEKRYVSAMVDLSHVEKHLLKEAA